MNPRDLSELLAPLTRQVGDLRRQLNGLQATVLHRLAAHTHDVIVTDQTTGARYRVVVVAGALTLEPL